MDSIPRSSRFAGLGSVPGVQASIPGMSIRVISGAEGERDQWVPVEVPKGPLDGPESGHENGQS